MPSLQKVDGSLMKRLDFFCIFIFNLPLFRSRWWPALKERGECVDDHPVCCNISSHADFLGKSEFDDDSTLLHHFPPSVTLLRHRSEFFRLLVLLIITIE